MANSRSSTNTPARVSALNSVLLPAFGVAHERGAELAPAASALRLALALHALRARASARDALAHDAPVRLELRLAGAARADAAGLALESASTCR